MSSPALEPIFEAFALWRQGQREAVQSVADLIARHGVSSAPITQRLEGVMHRLDNPTLRVAFVAEFSRGKSELINAMFFADMGQRIMPASAGRTTMCPTEMGFDARSPQGLYLLPIETRLVNRSLMHWRQHRHEWVFVPIDVAQPQQIAQAMQQVTQTLAVRPEQARAMGLGDGDDLTPDHERSCVEIPQWRHAMLNIDMPLLRQGLVVMDTPGLNAVGVEPELTLGLLSQVDAVVFILAADLGVSQSDLDIWQDHLLPPSETEHNRLAVLNKIDILWDDLTADEDIQKQLHAQQHAVAQRLGLTPEQVVLVSAQKGLVARIKHDDDLLRKSELLVLESKMAHEVVRQHQAGLRRQVTSAMAYALDTARMQLGARQQLLAQQVQELQAMRGQNQDMLAHMRQRLAQELEQFNEACQQVQAIRLVHTRLTQGMLAPVALHALDEALQALGQTLVQTGMKWKGQKAFRDRFDRIKTMLLQLQQQSLEASEGLALLGAKLQDKLGFGIQAQARLDTRSAVHALEVLQIDLEAYFSMKHWWRMSRTGERERWLDGVKQRLIPVYAQVAQEIESWNHALLEPIDQQVAERRRFFERRVEVIERIASAAETVEHRLGQVQDECDAVGQALAQLDAVERD